jgi:hypothetical protein
MTPPQILSNKKPKKIQQNFWTPLFDIGFFWKPFLIQSGFKEGVWRTAPAAPVLLIRLIRAWLTAVKDAIIFMASLKTDQTWLVR